MSRRPSLSKAVFLDKDGTLVEDVPYNVDPARIVLAAGAAEACRALSDAGYALVVVTNQSGIARGLFDEAALAPVAARLRALIGVPLAGFYHCPHIEASGCECRKPLPGMLVRAAEGLGIDLDASWMVGDILNDVEAGARAGCRTILFDTGGETEWVTGPYRQPDFVVRSMSEVAETIFAAERLAA